jgi:hypothetical protein
MLSPVTGFVARFGNCFELPDDAEFPPVPATMLRAKGEKFSANMLVILKAAHRLLPGSTITIDNQPVVRPTIYNVSAEHPTTSTATSEKQPPRRRPISGIRASEFAPESATRLAKRLAKVSYDRAKSFLRAVTGPRVPAEVAEARLKQCLSNECGYLRDGNYCGACGCPRWKLAALSSKVTMANLACPCDPPYWGEYES